MDHAYAAQKTSRGLILELLKTQERVSGQELAAQTGISRTAVWKQIRRLRREGYRIDSARGLGYTLQETPDLLLPEEIQSGLRTRFVGRKIIHLPETDSTQARAKEAAEQGAVEGTIVLTEKQSRGRGRRRREWICLPGSILISVIFRPGIPPDQGSHFPLLAGVALAKAVEKVCPALAPSLKWPNDLILGKKKCAGILAEIASEPERISHLTLGLGLNCNCSRQEMDPALSEIATSLQIEAGRRIERTLLLQTLLLELEELYQEYLGLGFAPLRSKYKAMSNTLHSRVRVISTNWTLDGQALDIDESGGLIVQQPDGRQVTVTAGDVSIRS